MARRWTDAPLNLSGRTGTLRVVMTDRITSLTGTVQSDRDRRDHNVIAFPDGPTKWASPSRFVRTIRADADGRFQIRGLPPESAISSPRWITSRLAKNKTVSY